MVFGDLTKLFDTVIIEGLWKLLHKVGCPDKMITIKRLFHDGMKGRVFDSRKLPTLFGISFTLTLHFAFRYMDYGDYIQVRPDGGILNLWCFVARCKTTDMFIRDFLFSSDCALCALSLEDIQAVLSHH